MALKALSPQYQFFPPVWSSSHSYNKYLLSLKLRGFVTLYILGPFSFSLLASVCPVEKALHI